MEVQNVRLVDVFLLGPFMIWMGLQQSRPTWAMDLLVFAGAATIVYNGVRYLEVSRAGNQT